MYSRSVLNTNPFDCTSRFTLFIILSANSASSKPEARLFTGASPILDNIVLTASKTVVGLVAIIYKGKKRVNQR